MKLTNLQKWGIGIVIGAAAALVVGGFAIAGKMPPAVIYTVYGLITIVAGYLGIRVIAAPEVPPLE